MLQVLIFSVAVSSFAWQPATSLAATDKACRFVDAAPESHLVTRGDTLWDLASRFLHDPWCWPDVWENNREAVANPHLIYPGQQIRLDRVRGRLTTTPAENPAGSLPVVRLAPTIRANATVPPPLPLIASGWLPLLQRTPLMSMTDLAQAPRIVALSGDRRMAGAGDLIFVRSKPGAAQAPLSGELRRALAPVVDPDTGKPIALAARRLGRADLLRRASDGLQTMRVTEATEEVLAGDVLVAVPPAGSALTGLVPHPAVPLQGRVAAILQERRWASLHDLVVLNRGSRHGLDAGSAVDVVQPVRIGSHESPQDFLPASALGEAIATLLVVDVLEHAALAIVMRAQEPFSTGALLRSPDRAGK